TLFRSSGLQEKFGSVRRQAYISVGDIGLRLQDNGGGLVATSRRHGIGGSQFEHQGGYPAGRLIVALRVNYTQTVMAQLFPSHPGGQESQSLAVGIQRHGQEPRQQPHCPFRHSGSRCARESLWSY